MVPRLTQRAKAVIALAKQEAKRHGQEKMAAEHLLLGILKEGTGVAFNCLKAMGMNLARAVAEIENGAGGQKAGNESGEPCASWGAEAALAYAIEESEAMHHAYVGTEHLLLGVLRLPAGVARQVLASQGFSANQVREELIAILGGPKAPGESALLASPCAGGSPAAGLAEVISAWPTMDDETRARILAMIRRT